MKRLYLDCCCYNRPFDDQEQERVKRETEAVLAILGMVDRGEVECAASATLLFELSRDPDPIRREKTMLRARRASVIAPWTPEIERLAAEIESSGLRRMDAAHLASAFYARCAAFITVDRGILRRAPKTDALRGMAIQSPLTWLEDCGE